MHPPGDSQKTPASFDISVTRSFQESVFSGNLKETCIWYLNMIVIQFSSSLNKRRKTLSWGWRNASPYSTVRPQTIDLSVRFSADSSKIGPTKLRNSTILLFFTLPTLHISLELLIPQKWFTYNFLQNQTRNTAKIQSKDPTQKIKFTIYHYFFIISNSKTVTIHDHPPDSSKKARD